MKKEAEVITRKKKAEDKRRQESREYRDLSKLSEQVGKHGLSVLLLPRQGHVELPHHVLLLDPLHHEPAVKRPVQL